MGIDLDVERLALARRFGATSEAGVSAARFGRKFGFHNSSTGWQATFAEPCVAAVVVASRYDACAKQALAALRAGKQVFCRKSSKRANRLVARYRDSWTLTRSSSPSGHRPSSVPRESRQTHANSLAARAV